MTKDASIAQYINELNIFTIQLSLVIIKFENEARALILLSLLPNSWSTTVTVVISMSGSIKIKFDDVYDMVLNEKIWQRVLGESSFSLVLQIKPKEEIHSGYIDVVN